MKLSKFVYVDHKGLFDAYECNMGFRNTPHKEEHLMEQHEKIWRPCEPVDSPYIGYGWYAKKLSDIERDSNEMFNMQHFANTFDIKNTNLENVYIIFTLRRSAVVRPVMPPPPSYIGWCLA